MKFQTLHCHTTTSDGQLNYLEVLKICEEKGIGTVAFTDHDALLSESNVKILREYSGPVKWISGIEISSGLPKELAHLKGGVHMVGLFVDPQNSDLVFYCQMAQKLRVERMEKIVRNLSNLGFDITEKNCLEASGGESVGRPHIVKALVSKEENLKIIEGLRKKMEDEAKKDNKIHKKYREMTALGEGQYPYALFLSDDAFIPGVYVNSLNNITLDECVNMVRSAGGISILAHWFTDKHNLNSAFLEKLFKENRLDGAETVYGIPDYPRERLEQDRLIIKKLLVKYSKVESGGVDAHSKDHFKLFIENQWYAKMTFRLVEKMIEKSKVDTTWSSLG